MENGRMLQVLPAGGQRHPASSSTAVGESLTWTLSNARRAAQHLDDLLRLQALSLSVGWALEVARTKTLTVATSSM